jgi:hypothetical protein
VAGRGEISDLRLASAVNKAEIEPGTIPFSLADGDPSTISTKHAVHKNVAGIRFPEGAHVEFGPFPAGMGRGTAPSVQGWMNRNGYNFTITGETEIGKVLRVARLLGFPAVQSAAEGTAQVDLQVMGAWAGRSFPGPQVTGTAKLRDVRVSLRGTGGAVEISSADLTLSSSDARVEKVIAKAAGTSWTGSLAMPRGCGAPGACEVHFNLSANQIGLSELREWVNPQPKERPWYRVLESRTQTGAPFLAALRASGRVSAGRLLLPRGFEAGRVSANVSLDGGKVQVSELTADFLGGKHRGEWRADFSASPGGCHGSGIFTGISLARLADTMKDQWIAGTANASYEIRGTCPTGFWTSSDGTLQFDVKDGALPHFSLADDAGPLKVTRFAGKARLLAGKLEAKDAKLDSASGKFLVSGTASLKQELDLNLARDPNGSPAAGFTITGTLAQPRVIRSGAETQAQLKR